MDDVLVAEMNRQREATSMVMQEAARLAQSFAGLQAVITQMQNVARTHVAMSARLATAEDRLIQFGKELQTLSPPPLPRTNEVPLLTPETPEAPKP